MLWLRQNFSYIFADILTTTLKILIAIQGTALRSLSTRKNIFKNYKKKNFDLHKNARSFLAFFTHFAL